MIYIIDSNDMISKAFYGLMNQYIDVTNVLNSILLKDSLVIISSNIFNYDPFFGKIKELKILLKSGKKIQLTDNNTLQYNVINTNDNNIIINNTNDNNIIINNTNDNNIIINNTNDNNIIINNNNTNNDNIIINNNNTNDNNIIINNTNDNNIIINNNDTNDNNIIINNNDTNDNNIIINNNDTIYYNRIEKILKPIVKTQLDYIISTNARDENNIIEWILYHLLIGFDKILIIDHLSLIPIKKIIEPYYWKHRVEVIRNDSTTPIKMHILNKVIIPYMMKHCNKYFIHLDADEYIYIKDNMTIDYLLNCEKYKYLQNSNIIALNWLMFGSNNMMTNNNKYKCLIPTYTRSANVMHYNFKCLIKINKNQQFTFINPHQILISNIPSIYINTMGKKTQYMHNVEQHFIDTVPHENINTIPCYINHYSIQCKEDYMKRKIRRNRDDLPTPHNDDIQCLIQFNETDNTNILSYYKSIEYMIENIKFNYGFVLLRYVCSVETDNMWKECYNSIRKFYNNKIVIIDDNSNPLYLTEILTVNTVIINSEYPRRGEFLPYYYYIKNKFFDRMVVIHDSMVFKSYYNFNTINRYKNFSRLFSFGNSSYKSDIGYFKEMSKYLKNGNILNQYHMNNINRMIGCFGICYVIDYNYIVEIEKKYNISNMIKYIDTRPKRQTLERLLSCLFEMDRYNSNFTTPNDIFGDIFSNNNSIIMKRFFGR